MDLEISKKALEDYVEWMRLNKSYLIERWDIPRYYTKGVEDYFVEGCRVRYDEALPGGNRVGLHECNWHKCFVIWGV